ncbi:MAG: hypothetical protein WA144_02860 [Candidatus Methanoperedens sp.]
MRNLGTILKSSELVIFEIKDENYQLNLIKVLNEHKVDDKVLWEKKKIKGQTESFALSLE